jgi:succinate dehydrogenase / fumarate reductase cytochrome b subunit
MVSGDVYALCASGEEVLMEVADRNNREGMKGWLNPSRYGWERVSYWLQRLTGVGLLAYFVGHIYETSSLTQGPDAWAAMLELTQTPMGHLILILVIGMSTYHSANGIRLIFTHGGKGLGKPGRPDYPYDAVSLNYRQKSGIWIALILAVVAMLYGASVLFGGE